MEIFKKNGQFFILKALNSPSPRPSSFTIFVGGKEFTNPFLGLLNSPGKNIEIF
jgi:hypothetical protein